jgi:acetolactate synthase I/II/III large subunit
MKNSCSTTGAQRICEWLLAIDVEYVFCVPSIYIFPLVKEIIRHPKLKLVVAAHELGAGYMADGYARASGNIGVCLVAGGPGASNALTAAITARLDNSPVLFLSSDVDSQYSGVGKFQDVGPAGTNDVALFKQAVDFSECLKSIESIDRYFTMAIMALFKQQTAHLTIPTDIFNHEKNFQEAVSILRPKVSNDSEKSLVEQGELLHYLKTSKKILLYVGRRAVTKRNIKTLLDIIERFNVPVVTSLDAKSMLCESHLLVVGNVGYGGSLVANKFLFTQEFDLLLCIGVDLNEKNLCDQQQRLRTNCKSIVQIDQQKARFNSLLKVDKTFIVESLSSQLRFLIEIDGKALDDLKADVEYRKQWLASVLVNKGKALAINNTSLVDSDKLSDNFIVPILRKCFPKPSTIIFPDSGSSRALAGESWEALTSLSFFSSTSTAPTGWAIGAGIGGKFARNDCPMIVLTGDISMLMHGLELVTAVRYSLPIIFFVLDNGGNISSLRANRNSPDIYPVSQTSAVNWSQFAQSIDMQAVEVSTVGELNMACQDWTKDGPYLVHVKLDTGLNLNALNRCLDA